MRFQEFKHFISEETIDVNTLASRNSNYYRNLINLIRAGSEVQVTIAKTKTSPKVVKMVVFDQTAADELEALWNPTGKDKKEVASRDQVLAMKNLMLPALDGEMYKVTQIEKTKDIKQQVGDEGEEAFTKWWNKGNVAEGIMASAVIAKFEGEGAEITPDDIVNIITSIENNAYTSSTFGRPLSLKVTLGANDYKALLMSAEDRATFEQYDKSDEVYKLYDDCAYYVNNSSNVSTALEKIQAAAGEDAVEVSADGATYEAQHSTKADLWIAVGQTKERLLSIKTATVKHIGAVSGYEFDHMSKFFESVVGFGLPDEMREEFKKSPATQFLPGEDGKPDKTQPNPEYVRMSSSERSSVIRDAMNYNFQVATKDAYSWVFEQINDRLSGNSDEAEYDFVNTVANGVVHHATLGEDIRLVVISPSAKKAYTELHFGDNLFNALGEYDLVPVLDTEGKNYKLLVYGYPVGDTAQRLQNDKTMFVQLRSYIQDGAARNVVEMGGLLKRLSDVTDEQEGAQPQQAAPVAKKANTKAVATAPAEPTTAQSGTPSGMTNIAPAGLPMNATDMEPEQQGHDELDAIKKNAGIVVENK